MVTRIGNEIPSSLDLLPLGQRFGNKEMLSTKMRPNEKYSHVTALVDHGKKPPKCVADPLADQIVTKLKGENFGRMAPQTLSRLLLDGTSPPTPILFYEEEVMRTGKFPP